ncbi:uncharacterized protein [Typha angustifolia]|uniref:uncharacterized protein n=1 Tax=Typha angustifolia TaxID=59011 RepID=UPI003C2F89AC
MEAALSLRTNPAGLSLRRHAERPNGVKQVGPGRVRPAKAEATSPPPPRPPPQAARVVAVGAGVLFTCCLGAAYLHRGAFAQQPAPTRNDSMIVDTQTNAIDVLSEILLKKSSSQEDSGSKTLLLDLVYAQICRELLPLAIVRGGRRQRNLMDLVYEHVKKESYSTLVGMDREDEILNLLYKEWTALSNTEKKYNLGLLLTQVMINQRNYTKAKEVCEQLLDSKLRIESDPRPQLHSAIIKMMLAVEKMLSRETKDVEGVKKLVNGAIDDWKKFDLSLLSPPEETN